MALPAEGVIADTELLDVTRGFSFRRLVTFYEDTAHTKPFNLTGLTVKLVIAGLGTLASGAGLTITPLTGQIAIKLTPAQTTAFVAAQTHYYFSFEENAEEIVGPLSGTMTFSNP